MYEVSKPWVKISRHGYLTQIRATHPGPGVWYRGEIGPEGQISYEFGAKDGKIVVAKECFHGQARSNAFNQIKQLAKGGA